MFIWMTVSNYKDEQKYILESHRIAYTIQYIYIYRFQELYLNRI